MNDMTRAEKCAVRAADIAISALGLLLTSPLFLGVMTTITAEDHGPAFFKQERIGLHGKPFNIYKFRTMKTDAEKNGPALCKGKNDPRLTRTGRFLRNHHLDELPQLWNVLKGDMSMIGPRPERKCYIDKIMAKDPRYEQLYQVRPGATSYATLYNGYTDTIEKMLTRLEMDLSYLQERTIWTDMKLLVSTFISIICRQKF